MLCRVEQELAGSHSLQILAELCCDGVLKILWSSRCENPCVIAKQLGVGRARSPLLLAGNRMSAEERTAFQRRACLMDDRSFCAARIRDKRTRPDQRIELLQGLYNAGDRLSQKQEVGLPGCVSKTAPSI